MTGSNQKYDIWIKDAWILTMDEHFTEFKNASILIKDGLIEHIGSVAHFENLEAHQIIDAGRMILLPPFFNGHSHAAMSLLRGLGNDVPLLTWLQDYMWPAESKYMNASNVRLGSLISGIEMIRSGTNIFTDMYFFEEEVAQACKDLGMRCILGEGVLDFPTPNMKSPVESFNYTRNLLKRYHDDPLISLTIPAHSPYTCSKETLLAIAGFSQENKIPATIHLAETAQEVQDSLKMHGKTPVAYLRDLGYFDFQAICYHCNYLSTEDIEIFSEHQVSVITLPNSNMKLASGITPVPELLQADICVGLGTDGAASNNNNSMLSDLQMLVKLQKIAHKDPTVLNAKTGLKIATSNGAKAYKMNQLGSLEIGKSADIQFIDMDSPHMQPLYDPYAQIVYSMQNSDVRHLMVNGQFLMKDREILLVDEEKIKYQTREFAKILNID